MHRPRVAPLLHRGRTRHLDHLALCRVGASEHFSFHFWVQACRRRRHNAEDRFEEILWQHLLAPLQRQNAFDVGAKLPAHVADERDTRGYVPRLRAVSHEPELHGEVAWLQPGAGIHSRGVGFEGEAGFGAKVGDLPLRDAPETDRTHQSVAVEGAWADHLA